MSHDLTEFLDLLKILVRTPSVVGAEQPFFRVLRRELEETGVTVTQFQGLVVAQGEDPESLLLSAHVDRHGLVCTGPNEFQYAAFISRYQGDLTGDSILGRITSATSGRLNGATLQIPTTGYHTAQESASLESLRAVLDMLLTMAELD